MMKVPRQKPKGGRTRPNTSRIHKLKDVHYRLWRFYWKRSRILPNEQYYDFQIAAARYFGVDRSTISRRLAVLIENEAVVVVRLEYRAASGFFTSKIIQPTEPPPDEEAFGVFEASKASRTSPRAEMHVDEVLGNKGSATTCRNAQENTNSSPQLYRDIPVSVKGTGLQVTLSRAKMHADQVVEKTASSPHAEMHAVKADLGTRIIAAHQKLAEIEKASADSVAKFGDDGGWGPTLTKQRAEVQRLEAELAGPEVA